MFTLQTKKAMLKAILTRNSPFYIQFYISKFCHLSCKMCNIVEANSEFQPFDHEQIVNIADNLVKIGAGVVLLTGGEPFMRPDIDEIVRIFISKKLNVRLQTAGLYSKRDRIAKCAEYGARDINVSLDSLDADLSDYINNVEGSFNNAVKTISFISKTFPNKDSICAFGCVLSRYNVDEIEAILEFATRIGWWLSLVPVHITETPNPMDFRGYDDYFRFSPEDYPKIKTLIDRLKKKKKAGARLFDSDDYLDSIYHFITTGKPNWRKNDICDAGKLYFAINPDASFAPCCDFKYPKTVYVYDPDFPEIFKSQQLKSAVKKIAEACPGCNYGSYPEMTLSVRSFSTMRERLVTQFKAGQQSIKPFEEDKLHQILNDIKQQHDIYRKDRSFPFREQKKWPKVDNIPSKLWNVDVV